MSKKPSIPDAWDDDWEIQVDNISKSKKGITLTKAECLAEHVETNRKIWKSADEPDEFIFLKTHDNIPLKSEFKPALKVLSRNPAPSIVKEIDQNTRTAQFKKDDDEYNLEQGQQIPPEEMRLKALKGLEEKQKRYDEARARILGVPSKSSLSGDFSTYPNSNIETMRSPRTSERAKKSSRGIRYNDPGLFDTNSSPSRPELSRNSSTDSSRPLQREYTDIIRKPRGPDSTGKTGFQFLKKRTK